MAGMEPMWGVIIGMAIGGLIKMLFFSGGRKGKKAFKTGKCPTCDAGLIEKPFSTVTLYVCPNKHGYLGGSEWVSAKRLAKMTKPIKDMTLEELPDRGYIIFWVMYHELHGDGPIDTRRVDNAPKPRT